MNQDVSDEELFAQLFVKYDLGRKVKVYENFTITYNLQQVSEMHKSQLVDLMFQIQQQYHSDYDLTLAQLKQTDKSVLVRMINEIINDDLTAFYSSVTRAKYELEPQKRRDLHNFFETLYKKIRIQKRMKKEQE